MVIVFVDCVLVMVLGWIALEMMVVELDVDEEAQWCYFGVEPLVV